ncbi:unnamed protein product [Arctogadus glacialis]
MEGLVSEPGGLKHTTYNQPPAINQSGASVCCKPAAEDGPIPRQLETSCKAGMFSGGGKFCIVGQSKRMSDAWVCGSEALDVLYFAEAALA